MIKFLVILFVVVSIGIGWFVLFKKRNEASWEVVTPQLWKLVDIDEPLEPLATGFHWIEGPVWSSEENALLFSDIPANIIYRWDEKNGVTDYLKFSGYFGIESFTGSKPGSNGLAFDKEKRLIITEHGNRRVSRREHDGQIIGLVDRYEGKRLNSPNDVIVAKNGDIFFTDPPYGLPAVMNDPGKELPFQGVYRFDGETLTLLTDVLKYPNGLGISPDGKTFYVSNSGRGEFMWVAFDFDGRKLTNQRLLLDVTDVGTQRKGAPDGFCIDEEGNLFSSGPGGLYVISPEGKILGFLNIGHPVSNCTWGGDGSELYITGDDTLYRLKMKTRGNE